MVYDNVLYDNVGYLLVDFFALFSQFVFTISIMIAIKNEYIFMGSIFWAIAIERIPLI